MLYSKVSKAAERSKRRRHVTFVILYGIYEMIMNILEMWADTQRDGRPAEYRWRPFFNAAKFG